MRSIRRWPSRARSCAIATRSAWKLLGMENYGFFIYGLGHYSFFGAHRPGHTDIWNEYKTNPHEFVAAGRTHAGCRRHTGDVADALEGI